MALPFPPPCRLFFILAREAPTGVIFRRGPTKRVQIIRWDTTDDTFKPGQWFHGRLYEDWCDLSPDGTKLIYYAQKINGRTLSDKEYTATWTAISKVPYLTALALWPLGHSVFGGGGVFESNDKVLLHARGKAHPAHRPKGLTVGDTLNERFRSPLIYRLKAYGWQNNKKPHPTLPFSITMQRSKHDRYSFALQAQEDASLPLEEVTWADWDHAGRLVYARQGKLFAAKVRDSGVQREMELADFNAHKPEPVAPPAWAKEW